MKGKTNNPNGRPAGTPNKITAGLREKIHSILSDNIDRVQDDLNELDPKDRLQILEKLLSYALPKLQSMDITSQLELEYTRLERLLATASPEAIDSVVEKIHLLKIQIDNEQN